MTGKKFSFPSVALQKVFDMDFPPAAAVCCGVFKHPLLRNARKRHSKNLKGPYKNTAASGHLADIRRFQQLLSSAFSTPC
jgi:hypothetical protein